MDAGTKLPAEGHARRAGKAMSPATELLAYVPAYGLLAWGFVLAAKWARAG